MAIDRLHEAKPTRLHRHDGVWTLDVERFVSLGQGVLRPKMERLQGETVIVQYLSRNPASIALGRSATQLMRDTSLPNQTAAPVFEVVGESWAPIWSTENVTVSLPPPAPPRPEPPTTVSGPDVDALIRALGAMRLAHNKLQARVDELEARLAALATTTLQITPPPSDTR